MKLGVDQRTSLDDDDGDDDDDRAVSCLLEEEHWRTTKLLGPTTTLVHIEPRVRRDDPSFSLLPLSWWNRRNPSLSDSFWHFPFERTVVIHLQPFANMSLIQYHLLIIILPFFNHLTNLPVPYEDPKRKQLRELFLSNLEHLVLSH